jgi:hypothetical protein
MYRFLLTKIDLALLPFTEDVTEAKFVAGYAQVSKETYEGAKETY